MLFKLKYWLVSISWPRSFKVLKGKILMIPIPSKVIRQINIFFWLSTGFSRISQWLTRTSDIIWIMLKDKKSEEIAKNQKIKAVWKLCYCYKFKTNKPVTQRIGERKEKRTIPLRTLDEWNLLKDKTPIPCAQITKRRK